MQKKSNEYIQRKQEFLIVHFPEENSAEIFHPSWVTLLGEVSLPEYIFNNTLEYFDEYMLSYVLMSRLAKTPI